MGPCFGRFALSHIAAAALLLASTGAAALGLGRLTVQSALGETLKAEIDITSLTAEEAGSLKVRVAPPDAYRATGVEYNSVLAGTQVQVTRRDGKSYLRVSSDRAVQEPFVDVILELTWASGRLVREYTLLFDPPAASRPASPAPATIASPVFAQAPAPAPLAPVAASSEAASRSKAEPKPRVETAPKPARPAPAAAEKAPAASEYKVKPGDVLYRIAVKTQPAGVSLDQMLVGLYRNNPDAFVDGNMNRLKSGAVLQVPAGDSLAGLTPAEARQVIRAQSTDFSAYRQRLGAAAPTLKQEHNERQAKGQVQTAVEDKKPAANTAPDKLTLSKAASAADAAAAKVAKASKETEQKDAAARVAELSRNVEELKKLSSAAKPAASAVPATATAAAKPAVDASPTTAPALALPAAQAPSAPASAASRVAAASAAKPAASAASAALAPPPETPVAEPGLIDQLLDNSLLLPLGGALIAALGALGLYRLRGRKDASKPDTGFHESRVQPDSFFGATGGARVDTRESAGVGSSMNYSLSQLDAIGDVDPVAEADVYLAYGRDLQAEEILKEALRANPERLAIRLKLLEVYAKRRDTKGFEQLAIQLFAETQGAGEDWAKAQELGRQIDPDNPLYQPGGAPTQLDGSHEERPEPMNASTLPYTASTGTHPTEALSRPVADTGPASGFDLDLDLDLGAPTPAPASPLAMQATQAMATSVEQAPLSMDFDLSEPEAPAARVTPDSSGDLEFDLDLPLDAADKPAPEQGGALDFDLSSIDLSLPDSHGPETLAHAPEPIPAAESSAFDGDLPLEFEGMLNQQAAAELQAPVDHLAQAQDALADDEGDPLMRQLELADEFRQIGDTEGAREVLQELIAKSGGALRDKAQAMLDELR
ncbi:pilus assembly protein FimV [Paucibacter oligotrophus]|uniref:Pilus assembly protein FimV n=1 Tax=Roseateles oligotrophus TaxID=1769250 RepID=A0A840L7P6_9BURK|nr:FimV/HubP family polar landmark protein [Roseateles oligotrophus]MBB4844086.1 pilus assembly protein FimV [Roseateles oligotrophus]